MSNNTQLSNVHNYIISQDENKYAVITVLHTLTHVKVLLLLAGTQRLLILFYLPKLKQRVSVLLFNDVNQLQHVRNLQF